jgi:hypothetical protein
VAWSWAIASCRGTSHVRDNSECQDTSRCAALGPNKDVLLALVSDGAGTAKFGKQGSALTCRTLVEAARSHFTTAASLPTDDEIFDWIDLVRTRIEKAAQTREAARRDFAATVVAACVTPTEALVIHIGDGAAVFQNEHNWTVPSWPAQGEYASTTFFITDDPAPSIRIERLPTPPKSVAVFTDGIERLVLRFSDQTPSATFFEKFIGTVRASGQPGANPALNQSLAKYLNSDQINERTDDDKSLILAAQV